MILDWMRKIHQLEYAHRYQSLDWSFREKAIGITAFVISTLIAFSYRFPTVEIDTFNKLPFFVKQSFFVPFASLVLAILTGIQTFLKPNEKSETHRKAGSQYEKLRHRIEVILTSKNDDEESIKNLEQIRKEWESLDAINVSNRNFNKGKKMALSFKKYPKELSFLNDANS